MKPYLPLTLAALILGPAALAWTFQDADVDADVDADAQAQSENEREQFALAQKAFEIADYDRNGWLSFRELKDSLGTDRPRYLVYDSDRNGKVTRPEFARLCLATYRKYGAFKIPTPNPADPTAAQLLEGLGIIDGEEEEPLYEPVDADSILELFGTPRPRPPREGSAPEPSLIQGPVHSFRRLDYDNDGTIGPDDLEVLLLGAGLTDRPKALIASIDTNGDGHLSEQEFQASMKHLK